jgi:hypothetical protein
MSRLAAPVATPCVVATDPPFSNFDFVEREFAGSPPIRRLFSQARSRKVRTLVIEEVSPEGPIAAENTELQQLFPDYRMVALRRLSFWKSSFTDASAIPSLCDEDCVGWAILKLDYCPSKNIRRWHVFESVIRKFAHEHNYVPCGKLIDFRVGDHTFRLPGVLYCQQNGLNKACAQVALRSVCSAFLGDPNLTFRRINELAFAPDPPANPGNGLTTDQIKQVLDSLGIPNFGIYYPKLPGRGKWRSRLPYQKILYSGIECGCGALLAFKTSGPRAPNCGHIIPVFGHTFNEDTWAPRGEGAYFQIGKDIRYIPSAAWMSSFIAHDDNFGSNLCVPKEYVRPAKAVYAVALFPLGYVAPGFVAEVAASRYFYSLLKQLDGSGNRWRERLLEAVENKELILRTVAATRDQYIAHLRTMADWQEHREEAELVTVLASFLPEKLWMTEVSIPDLFSTNLRKLGELLLNGALTVSDQPDYSKFVLGRFPGRYIFFDHLDGRKHPHFLTAESRIESHTPLLVH